jgi:uncharacterized protein
MHTAFVVKATRLCNLRCSYCHDWRATGERMSSETLRLLIQRALEDPLHTITTFQWHGGEPTVMPISFYRKAVYLQQSLRQPDQAVFNAIQTNATRLTAEWIEFLRAHRFRVSISMDGPPELHDRQRRFVSGRGSFDAVRRGIALLQEHEIDFKVIMVIDQAALSLGPDYVFDALVSLGVKNYSLLGVKPPIDPAAVPGTRAEPYLDPVQMGRFLIEIYDRWKAHRGDAINIRELRDIEYRLAARAPVVCTMAGGCLGQVFVVEPSGQVAHCELFQGDARYTLGNVFTNSFAELRASSRMKTLQAENERDLADMRGCPDFGVCNGWCPHERYIGRRHQLGYDKRCCGLRELIEHVRARQGPETVSAADQSV